MVTGGGPEARGLRPVTSPRLFFWMDCGRNHAPREDAMRSWMADWRSRREVILEPDSNHWNRSLMRRRCPGGVLPAIVVGGLLAAGPTLGAEPAPGPLMLCDGHPVRIVINQKLVSSWGGLRVGQQVKARVEGDVMDGSGVVIPDGSPVELRIRHMRRGQMGHGRGQLLLEAVLTRDVDGLRVLLQGGLYVEGKKHLVIDYIPVPFVSIRDLGFSLLFASVLGSGGSAKIAKGTTFEATVEGDHLVASRPERITALN